MYFEVWLKELSIRRNKGGRLGNSRTYNDNVTIHFMRNSSSENVRDLNYYRSCKIYKKIGSKIFCKVSPNFKIRIKINFGRN